MGKHVLVHTGNAGEAVVFAAAAVWSLSATAGELLPYRWIPGGVRERIEIRIIQKDEKAYCNRTGSPLLEALFLESELFYRECQ